MNTINIPLTTRMNLRKLAEKAEELRMMQIQLRMMKIQCVQELQDIGILDGNDQFKSSHTNKIRPIVSDWSKIIHNEWLDENKPSDIIENVIQKIEELPIDK